MSAFTHGFNHGFFAGLINRMTGGFGMFNSCCWNSAPIFLTPSYDFNNFSRYQEPTIQMPTIWSGNVPNFSNVQANWNDVTNINLNTNYSTAGLMNSQPNWLSQGLNNNASMQAPNFQNNFGWGDTFVSTSGTKHASTKKLNTADCNKYDNIIKKYAKKYNVDPNLVKAMIKQESSFKAKAVSPAGAKGLMQLTPDTAREMGVNNVFDPEQNIEGGVKYISKMLKKYNGNTKLALAAYNAGSGNVKNGKIPQNGETPKYVNAVMKYYNEYKQA